MRDNLILSEKFRPKTVNECILPEATKDQVNGLIASGNLQSLLFIGSAGVGKTTLARAIANEIGADVLFINASLDGNIDTIRTSVMKFASTVSFTDSKKITILDEFDGATMVAQQSLRGIIEEFSHNHTFILTGNFVNKIIEPIRSRCKIIDFKIPSKDKPLIVAKFLKRLFSILESEKIDYDKEAVAALVMKKYPDYRSILNEIQGYSAGGRIDAGILANLSDAVFDQLITSLKNKKFSDIRKWVADNSDIESSDMFRMFYDSASDKLESKSIPELILQIGEFSYKDYFCVDKELNRIAFLTTLLMSSNIIWK